MEKKRNARTPRWGIRQKILLMMKLKLFLVLIVCGPVTAAVHSQNNILDVQWKNVALEQVIWELEDGLYIYVLDG